MNAHHLRQTLTALALLGTLPAVAAAEIEYEFFLVESFNTSYNLAETFVWDINEQNVAVGTDTFGGFIWDEVDGKMQLPWSGPRDIVETGFVVYDTGPYHPFTSEQYSVSAPPGGPPITALLGLNDALQGVGLASTGGPSCEPFDCLYDCGHPLVWDPQSGSSLIQGITDLKVMFEVNNSNVAIGMIVHGCDDNQAIVYDLNTGAWTNLSDTLPPITSLGIAAQTWPTGISDAGHVVGEASFGTGAGGFIWTAAAGHDILPGLHPDEVDRVSPEDVNSEGAVVGAAFNGSAWKAFIWEADRGIRDLSAHVQPAPANFLLDRATGINDQGWITGYGHFGPGWGTSRGFVLKPIVQPARPGDVDGDGDVDVEDLVAVIVGWGPCAGCAADLDGSGAVDVDDLVAVILNWG